MKTTNKLKLSPKVISNRLHTIWCGLAQSMDSKGLYLEDEDYQIYSLRSEEEGPEFYARHMHALRTDLLSGLENHKFVLRARFALQPGTALPKFMFKAFARVFRVDDGVLRDDMDLCAVKIVNQLTAAFTKIDGGHKPESEHQVIADFLSTESRLAATKINFESELAGGVLLDTVLTAARHILGRVLGGVNPLSITPRHSSGVSACNTPLHERYELPRYIEQIDSVYPFDQYYFASSTHFVDELEVWLNTREGYTPCAKVLLVPKDCRGPRLISCEPRETMWLQQGQMSSIVKATETHKRTKGAVNFTDQRPNQRAARLGSVNWKFPELNRNYASLDLSNASDCIRLDLVERLMPKNWYEALLASRSPRTQLPNGQVVTLAKFAPMGSATCFPVMALCIWSILTARLPQGTPILVYGDDIIVPARFAEKATEVLSSVHLIVNTRKSFSKGPFRESCGKEFCAGLDVSPVKLRVNPYDDEASRDGLIAFHNNLFCGTCVEPLWLQDILAEWYGPIPTTQFTVSTTTATWKGHDCPMRIDTSPSQPLTGVLWKWQPCNLLFRTRTHKDHQVVETCIRVAKTLPVEYWVDDWSQLFRALVNPRRDEPLGADTPAKGVCKYRWMWVRLEDETPL